ncbi:MBL fold metallo-hydrolase [Chitinimonas taiwanensis]|uniref:Phosphoribosyl 1,2-cyclic phosphate phosphodiesterase n=1 Tax=Chitinimonas taiwanensis DSM 18899 TaxID=1121279 RepID=A0A1K2HSG0_9NEIS|nr:MBL fold metallo-hydrolase [Chitinimonas taiwanensis]SFZ79210.1 phosphoribosyl 1,2-cyclic phosphate phosphodiesterase [Chitinimonas taiwanensis DSM 18899]
MSVEVLILGCGSSAGTPAIGCPCPTCTSPDPRNRRTRASSVLRANGLNFLIDSGPDLRTQALREGLTQVDAVLYTHPHADHLNGIDDLRAFCYVNKAPLPIFGNDFMMQDVQNRFHYTTLPPGPWWDKPVLQPTPVVGPFCHRGVEIVPIPVLHGRWTIYGYRIGRVAYITDVSEIPEASFDLLQGLDLLLLDCLRNQPHHTHFGVEQSIAAAQRIGARHTVFIHMTHELEYHALNARLPHGMEVAYDGMRLISA